MSIEFFHLQANFSSELSVVASDENATSNVIYIRILKDGKEDNEIGAEHDVILRFICLSWCLSYPLSQFL